jgi:hypothetical protein
MSMTEGLGPDDDLSIRGDIETTSVADLLRSLLASRETGILTFRSEETTKSIYIREGQVVYAASTNPDERLGEHLLLKGRITVRHYLEASRRIGPGRRLGAILVELGAVETEDLIPAVEQQVREIVLELFSWTRGTYELVLKDMDPESVMVLRLPTENLILEGIRRTTAWTRVQKGCGDLDDILVPTGNTEILYRLELSDEEQELLAQVTGRATVEQICQVSYLSNFETCRLLWALQVLGVLRRAGAQEAAHPPDDDRESDLDLEGIVETFNRMFGRIYVFLRGRLGEVVDQFMEDVFEEVSRQYGALFAGVDLKQYGRADFEQLLANVADLPPEQRKALMVSGLNELVFIIQLAVRTRFGSQEEAVVAGIIKDGLKRLHAHREAPPQ